MKKYLICLLIVFTSCNAQQKNENTLSEKETENGEITTYYFIRHAEKDTSNPNEKDPELIEAGVLRAEKWNSTFKDINFDLVYSSNYKRTKATAAPIAARLKKEVLIYDAAKLNDDDFKVNTVGKTVLVVGHSNTNPAFVNYIIGENKYQDIPDEESGSLFIVRILPDGTKLSEVLYIN